MLRIIDATEWVPVFRPSPLGLAEGKAWRLRTETGMTRAGGAGRGKYKMRGWR